MVGDPRRLRGHNATATFCIASRDRPGLIATAGEDGCVCWFDMRCKDVLFVMLVGEDPISSLCFKPGNEDIIYVSSGTEVKAFDVHSVSKLEGGRPSDERRATFRTLVPTLPHTAQPSILLAASWKWLESHNYNKEEINQIACNSRSCFLAAADDGGNVKIVDIRQQCLYKTLRAGHTSICTSVQFLPWRPWEVITGGLDSKLVMWDFSKGRPRKIVDFNVPDADGGCSAGQSLNPAFVHALAVPEVDMVDSVGKVCVVARGDGVVEVIDIESELASRKSKNSLKPHKGAQSKAKGNASSVQTGTQDQNWRKKLCLDNSLGGHTASASCVAFSMFGEKGKHIVSGGNDKSVKVWDWCRYFDDVQTSSNLDLMHLNINLSNKVNWLCTTPADSENLIVCDTSKVVKVYTVA